jgi:peptide/nickel transport system ATP-binding protein
MNEMRSPDLSLVEAQTEKPEAYVKVKDLEVRFVSREATVKAVNGVSFELKKGEVLCVIGESGSGKSVMMRSLLQLHPKKRTRISGEMRVGEHDIMKATDKQMSELRGSTVSMIFQEPMTALDPLYTIGDQIAETVMRHEKVDRDAGWKRALELLELVRVPSPERRLKAYPHELSGGLRQRAMIAVALSCRPTLLLADEPTTALDASVQIQVLVLLRKLQREMGMSMIFVTHDLGVAAQIADKVAVMYAGRIIEYGNARDVLMHPEHPYTRAMLSSTIKDQVRGAQLETIAGTPPDLRALPDGCSFAPRCKYAGPDCFKEMPPEVADGRNHMARCAKVSVVRGLLAFDPGIAAPIHA